MWILGIETTGMAGSVALSRVPDGLPPAGEFLDEPIWCEDLPVERRSAQTLAPAMQALFDKAGCQPRDIGLVAVCVGPGSFTGLRVGVGTAKTFAYAVGAQAVGIDTLDVLAHQVELVDGESASCILNAQRGELFVARYAYGIDCLEPCRIVSLDQWLSGLREGEHVIGPPLEKLCGKLPAGVRVAPPERWQPHASTVVALGAATWLAKPAGVSFNPFDLLPKYIRRVAAEEQWEARRS
jgi:tRNA threonylcarbamoyladenosine biosynthesis protein TsaB